MRDNLDFKQTEIGRIPKEWEVKQIEEFSKVDTGGTPSTKIKEYWNGNIRWMSSGEVHKKLVCDTDKKITETGLENSNAKILPENSIMMALSGQGKTKGTVAVLKVPSSCSQSLAAISVNNNVYYLYIFYNLEKRYTELRRLTGSKGREGLNLKMIRQIKLPLPPLPEQKKIAEILMTADEAIQKVDEAMQKTERLKKGLMQELLTKGIGHKEFTETEIGEMPKGWEVKKVIELFDIETGTTPSTKQAEYWIDGKINWVTPADMSKLNGKLYIQNSERKITDKGLKAANLTLMPTGSIIISTRAPVGYVAIIRGNATFNQGCKGLLPKKAKEINSEFYAYYLLSKKTILENASGGSTFKELTKSALEKFNIPLPPLSEQQKISEILSTVDSRMELLRKKKEKLERTKKGLMNDLLTGKKRVRLES